MSSIANNELSAVRVSAASGLPRELHTKMSMRRPLAAFAGARVLVTGGDADDSQENDGDLPP